MMAFSLIGVLIVLFGKIESPNVLYGMYCWLGFGTGYWAMFVTVGAEQFGTNIRATAATTIPNMVRGSVPAMLLLYQYFKPDTGVLLAAGIVGLIAYILGFYATLTIAETHGKDLDYLE